MRENKLPVALGFLELSLRFLTRKRAEDIESSVSELEGENSLTDLVNTCLVNEWRWPVFVFSLGTTEVLKVSNGYSSPLE